MPARLAGRVLLLAPLSRDEVAVGGQLRVRTGGAGFYAAWALARRGARVTLHTPLAPEDRDLLAALPPEVEVVTHPSRRTTRFRIEVDLERPNDRILRLLAASDPLDPQRIATIEDGSSLLLGPLLPDDLSPALLERLRAAPAPCDLGAQGLVRRIDAQGRVRIAPLDPGLDLPRLRALAGDEREWAALPRDIVDRASERIVTLGDRGSRIHLAGSEVPIEIAAAALHGPPREAIGLGDTFLAVYAWSRSSGLDPRDAGRDASAAAAALLEGGPPGGSQ
jgi:sugar/nucleoside kinase (ribokinase family)